jgi:RimJ/RimL family protein N-acetyltransferase
MIISNQGRSILIRQSTPEDAKILFQAYSDESFIRLYRSNNPAQSEEQLRDMLKERLKHPPLERGYIEFMIVHHQYGPIGVAMLGDYSKLHRRAEYLIGIFEKKHRGKKSTLEAMLLLLDLAFNAYDMNKLYGYVYDYNEFSLKSAMNLGFTHEGTLKNHHYLVHEKRFVSLYIDSLVVDDFRQHEKIRRLSLKFLGRDITRPYQEINAIPVEEEFTKQYTTQFLDKLRIHSTAYQSS